MSFPDDCPFCSVSSERFFNEVMDDLPEDIKEQFIVLKDNFPVSPGHTLIVPKQHYFNFEYLPHRFFVSLRKIISSVKYHLNKKYDPSGYNVGYNDGRAAGQTIYHFHIHVIPRYKGDVDNPRGGIRNVIPGKGDY